MVVKRKVSGGTRSDIGRKCRDTFISLKKTCFKLDIAFLGYLEDRTKKLFNISRLAEIIASRAAMRSKHFYSNFLSQLYEQLQKSLGDASQNGLKVDVCVAQGLKKQQ